MNHKTFFLLLVVVILLSCERNPKEKSTPNFRGKSVDKDTSETINDKSDETMALVMEQGEKITKKLQKKEKFITDRIVEKDIIVDSYSEIEDIEIEQPLNIEKYLPNGIIEKDSTIWIMANMEKHYRIFGYETPSVKARKLFLFSVFTNDVEGNPSNCKYGSFYDTSGIDRYKIKLKYTSDTLDFRKIAIFQDEVFQKFSYVEKKWLEFDNKE